MSDISQQEEQVIKWVHIQTLDLIKEQMVSDNFKDNICSIADYQTNGDRYYNPQTHNLFYYHGTEESLGEKKQQVQMIETGNGFYSLFSHAWANHGKLILSCDDIWLQVQFQVCSYISANAEELRDRFVEHQGKEEIEIIMNDVGMNWTIFMTRVINQIKNRVKNNVERDFLPQFTTTLPLQQELKHLAVMDIMKNYFSYTMGFECGITDVGFLGTDQDWVLLQQTIEGLVPLLHLPKEKSKYFSDFSDWIGRISDIVNKINNTRNEGKRLDLDFWNGVLQERRTYGSGSTTFLRGWIIPFLTNKYTKAELDINDIPSSRFYVPVKIDDNGAITHVEITGGFTGLIYNLQNHSYSSQQSIVIVKDIVKTNAEKKK